MQSMIKREVQSNGVFVSEEQVKTMYLGQELLELRALSHHLYSFVYLKKTTFSKVGLSFFVFFISASDFPYSSLDSDFNRL